MLDIGSNQDFSFAYPLESNEKHRVQNYLPNIHVQHNKTTIFRLHYGYRMFTQNLAGFVIKLSLFHPVALYFWGVVGEEDYSLYFAYF